MRGIKELNKIVKNPEEQRQQLYGLRDAVERIACQILRIQDWYIWTKTQNQRLSQQLKELSENMKHFQVFTYAN